MAKKWEGWLAFNFVAWSGLVRLDFSMAFVTKQISEDPRVHVSEGILYFDGSPDQLIALIVQENENWKRSDRGLSLFVSIVMILNGLIVTGCDGSKCPKLNDATEFSKRHVHDITGTIIKVFRLLQ